MKKVVLLAAVLFMANHAFAQSAKPANCNTPVDRMLKPGYDAYKAEQTVKQGTPSGFRGSGVDRVETAQTAVMETYRISRQVRNCDPKPAPSGGARATRQ